MMNSFFTSRDLRFALGRFATGICIVAVGRGEETQGITVNSFTSISLEPPLIMVSLMTAARLLSQLPVGAHFGVSILGGNQEDVSRHFAHQPLEGTLPTPLFMEGTVPLVSGCAAGLLCRVDQLIPAGDHVMVLAQVEGVFESSTDEGVLLYYRGKYQQSSFG